MKSSILAIIDGSSNNEAVCRWACSLAKATQSDIKVQSIIDDQLLLGLSGFDGASGLTGSGVFIAAHEAMLCTMTELYESILVSFCARVEGDIQVNVEKYIDRGKLPECVKLRAKPEDFIVMAATTANRNELWQISQSSSCPVLLVDQNGAEELILSEKTYKHPFFEKLETQLTNENALPATIESLRRRLKHLGPHAA